MKKKEKLLPHPSSASGEELVDSGSWVAGKDLEKQREFLNQQVARSLEKSIRSLTNIPFNFQQVKVLKASTAGDRLVVSVQTPLWLPEPSGDSEEYLGTRKQLGEFRRAFEEHLKRTMSAKNRGALSNILHSEFDAFVRTVICVRNQNVMSRVSKTTERKGAGRPHKKLDRETIATLRARSEVIGPALHEIRKEIGRWKAANPNLEDDEQCRDHIRKAYSDRFDWIPIFLENNWGYKTKTRKGEERTVRISDLTSWSAADRANLIVLEEHRRRTQQSVSLSKFQHRKYELGPKPRASSKAHRKVCKATRKA